MSDSYRPEDFPQFAVTVDIVLLSVADSLRVLVVERGVEPFRGRLALPGGFVQIDESVDAAARRELREETGLDINGMSGTHLEQLGTFGAVNRDPRMRVVSVAYLGLTSQELEPRHGTDAADAQWITVAAAKRSRLAFDHREILYAAVERARAKLEYTTLAATLAGPDFTLGELHRIYEVVWGTKLDLGNFRRKVLATHGFVEPTGVRRVSPSGGAPASVYRRGSGTELIPPIRRAS